jgi:3-phosphoshikimate 1-carboxyvinyltransferase
MTDIRIRPSSLHGTLFLPPSKSQTMRAFFFASLALGESEIRNALVSPDTEVMLASLKCLGASVLREDGVIKIRGVGGRPKVEGGHIDVGNSGLALRFLTAGFALGSRYMMITGDGSIQKLRPMQPLISALCRMGGSCSSVKNNGFAPLIVKGPVHSAKVIVDGQDSQPISALLMASSFLEGETEICVKNPGETPWIDLTLSWLDCFSVPLKRKEYRYYALQGSPEKRGFQYTVPGDLSSMAFPVAAALLTDSKILVENVPFNDPQGDKKLIAILLGMQGCLGIDEKRGQLSAEKSLLSSFCVDVNGCIDALPILAVLGCFAKGKSHLLNGFIARKKESDRLSSITQELRKMGAKIEEKRDSLIIEHSPLKGALLDSHKDHRIAMALTMAALASRGETILQGVECVQKSYPGFFDEMKKLGADIEVL